jgi:hypothetical protein
LRTARVPRRDRRLDRGHVAGGGEARSRAQHANVRRDLRDERDQLPRVMSWLPASQNTSPNARGGGGVMAGRRCARRLRDPVCQLWLSSDCGDRRGVPAAHFRLSRAGRRTGIWCSPDGVVGIGAEG